MGKLSMQNPKNNNDDDDDTERRRLLELISKKGLKVLTRTELEHLQILLELKDYRTNEKANKAKKKLLKKINIAIYELYDNNNT
jgi:hypothetical protein